MNKYVFKIPLVNLILGVVLVALAIVASEPVLNWIGDILNYAIAILIIVYAVVHFLKHKNEYKNKTAFIILAAELALAILLAILLMPFIDQVGPSLALGLVLYSHGFAYLLILQLLKQRSSFPTFLIYMAVLTLGAYILFGRPDLSILGWILITIIFVYGIILVIFGIDGLRRKK